MSIKVVNMYTKITDGTSVNTTASSGQWAGLSPFIIGPIEMYDGLTSRNFENCWQFAKVYQKFADQTGEPLDTYWDWAKKGWNDQKAHRYPMGKGKRPLYSLWKGKRLGYIEARKEIYGPLYAKYVQETESYQDLKRLYESGEDIILRDYDGYDHEKLGMSLTDVLNHYRKKMGHAFILKALLTNDTMIEEFIT